MKNAIFIPFVLLCMMLFTFPVFAMENEPEEFRGIPWGAPLPKNNIFGRNKWKLEYMYGNEYRRSEEVSIGGAKISSPINYVFLDSMGFACARVSFEGQENYELILKACIESWGKPLREIKYKTEETDKVTYLWLGKKIDVLLDYYFNLPASGTLDLALKGYEDALEKDAALWKQKKKGF